MRTIAGYIRVSAQMAEEIARSHCESHASDAYALTGERADCECGQHDGKPPIAPLLSANGIDIV